MKGRKDLFSGAEEVLLSLEKRLQFLARMTPKNFSELVEGTLWAFENGSEFPEPSYAVSRDLGSIPREIEAVRVVLGAHCQDAVGAILFHRAEELALSAVLVEKRGELAVREGAAALYRIEPEEAQELVVLAEQWLALEEPETLEDEEVSLAQAIQAELDARSIPSAVREVPLASRAAVGDNEIFVRRDCRLPRRIARRIALHEIVGHLLPRLAAAAPPFRLGPEGSAMDEEGRAVLIEERFGLLDGERRRELALRYLLASEMRGGGSLRTLIELGMARGMGVRQAVELAVRCYRGGGLGRETIYLAGYQRVKRAFDVEPELETYFERGRMSVAAARALRG